MSFSIGNTTSNATWGGSSTATVTISLSAGSVVVLGVHQVHGTIALSVSSITSTNLTFAQAPGAARTHVDTNIGAGTPHQDGEIWWAYSSGSLTSEVITVTSSGTPINGTIVVGECKGLPNPKSPWDANGALAATNDGHGNHPSVTASTNSSVPVGIWFSGSTIDGSVPENPGSWTAITAASNLGTGGTNSVTELYYQAFASQQSSASWSHTSSNIRNWLAIGTAFSNVPITYTFGTLIAS